MTEPLTHGKNYIIDPVTGDVIDPETGEVIEDHVVSMGAEWRAFSRDEWRRRARASDRVRLSVHDAGLHTDVYIPKFKTEKAAKALKLKLMNRKVRVSKSERKLVEMLMRMWHIARSLGLSDEVIETAGSILRKLNSFKPIRREVALEYIAAAITAAAKMHGVAIRGKELAEKLHLRPKKFWEALRDIEMLGLAKPVGVDPRKYLQGFANALGLSYRVVFLASKIIDLLKRRGITEGKDPAGIAAATLYIASILLDEKRPQKRIAKATGVTEVTIRNRYREIIDKLLFEVCL